MRWVQEIQRTDAPPHIFSPRSSHDGGNGFEFVWFAGAAGAAPDDADLGRLGSARGADCADCQSAAVKCASGGSGVGDGD